MFEWAKNLIFAALLVSVTNAFGDLVSLVLSSVLFFAGVLLVAYALIVKKEFKNIKTGYEKFSAAIVLVYIVVSFSSYLAKTMSLFG